MCGVPHHALEGYLGKLLAAGLKVAICDQVEDPAQAKGLVKREVTRVVTPGTVSDPALLEGKEESFLAGLVWEREAGAGAFLDLSTGTFFVRRWSTPEEAVEDLALLRPREVLFHAERGEEGFPVEIAEWAERECPCRTPLAGDRLFDPQRAGELLLRQFGAGTLRGFGLEEGELAVKAAAAALAYAQETQKNGLAHVRGIAVREAGDRLILDASTLANLEVFAGQRASTAATGRRRSTLLAVLDRTVTAPGGRTLREWLRRPLVDPKEIADRHKAVGALAAENPRRERLRERLARMADPERLVARAVLGTLTPREAAALRDALAEAPAILDDLAALSAIDPGAAPLLERLGETDPLPELPRRAGADAGGGAGAQHSGWRRDRGRGRSGPRPLPVADPRQQAAHPGPGGAGARADRDLLAQDPLQQGLRLLPGGHAGEPGAGAFRLHPQADPGQRRALRHPRDQGAGGADPLRRGAADRPGAAVLPRADLARRRRVGRADRARPRHRRARHPGLLRRGGGPQPLRPPEDGGGGGAGDHPRGAPPGGRAGEPRRLRAQRRRARRRGGADRPPDRPQHGGQVDLPAAGGADRPDGPGRELRAGRRGGDRGLRPHLHPRRRLGRPRPGGVHLHGGDDRDGEHPPPRDRPAAW